MDTAAQRQDRPWTAADFLPGGRQAFGDAWRHAWLTGRIPARAAPRPDHAAITAGRRRGDAEACRHAAGSG